MSFNNDSQLVSHLRRLLADMAAGMRKEDAEIAVRSVVPYFKRFDGRPDMGFCTLSSPEELPSDLRVDYVYIPTYLACAILMRAAVENKNLLQDERIRDTLFYGLNGCIGRNFFGHGYEGVSGFLDAMEIFAQGRVLRFVERRPEFNESFTAAINEAERYLKQELCSGREIEPWSKKSYEERANRVLGLLLRESKEPVDLFVYGTLMKGRSADVILDGCAYRGRYWLKDYGMLDLGAYPGVAAYPGESTVGEVYSVPADLLPSLDTYEDEGKLYTRKIVTVSNETTRIPVYVYIYNTPQGHGLQRTLWGAKPEDELWYACYGSNLSAARFSCYIEGGTCKENGRTYPGCTDKTRWIDEAVMTFPGEVYFGSRSSAWQNMGVAFFDPAGKGAAPMRLYKIRYSQLDDLRRMEGASADWYGRTVCLGVKDDLPIYTITSETRRPENAPCESYLRLIENAMKNELGLGDDAMPEAVKNALQNS